MPRLVYISALCTVLMASTSFAQARAEMSDAETKAYTESFEKAFRSAFRIKSVDQCLASAPDAASAGLDVTPSCSCVADILLATKSVKQLQEISMAQPNNEELKSVVASCLKSDPPRSVDRKRSD